MKNESPGTVFVDRKLYKTFIKNYIFSVNYKNYYKKTGISFIRYACFSKFCSYLFHNKSSTIGFLGIFGVPWLNLNLLCTAIVTWNMIMAGVYNTFYTWQHLICFLNTAFH